MVTEKLSITLPEEMVKFAKERISSGAYTSTSEVLRTAMRHWMIQEEARVQEILALREQVQASINDPRPRLTSAEMKTHLEKQFANIRQKFPGE